MDRVTKEGQMTKYKVILADCPWKYSDKRKNDPGYAGITYDVMSTKDLCSLPVKEIADKDCMLFMWVTSPMLPDCLEIMKAWGFKFKTVAFVWEKLNTRSGTPVSLMGRFTMGSCEYVLVGTKGHPQRVSKNVRQLVQAKRAGHSVKPKDVHNRIVELCGDVPRVELFARDTVEGWDCIGNGIDGKDIRDVLEEKRNQE